MKINLILIVVILLTLNILGFSLKLTSNNKLVEGEILENNTYLSEIDSNLENFTIIVLPDTQYYSQNYSWIFDNQTLWIKENIEKMNIVFVSHLGDLVQNWYSIDEWENANRSMSVLDGVVSWGVLPGNHDGFDDGNLLNYNYYFAYERFSDESWYGGAYQNNNTNSYQLFSGGGEDYIIFHLQYSPTQNVLSWASDVIDLFPEKKVIISTHEYIFSTHEYMVSFSDVGRSEIGEIIWEKLVKPHFDQIFLVLCGHNSWFAENTIVDFVDGAVVYQLLSDYQDRDNGGNGWLRILEFSPEDDKIFVKTYSPYLDEFEIDSNSQFVLDIGISNSTDGLTQFHYLVIVIVLTSTILSLIIFLKKRLNKSNTKNI
jgi:hypothetical protein